MYLTPRPAATKVSSQLHSNSVYTEHENIAGKLFSVIVILQHKKRLSRLGMLAAIHRNTMSSRWEM